MNRIAPPLRRQPAKLLLFLVSLGIVGVAVDVAGLWSLAIVAGVAVAVLLTAAVRARPHVA